MTRQDGIEERINLFMQNLHELYVIHFGVYYPLLTAPQFIAEYGDKRARIVCVDENQRSAYCFIDLSNGDILKTATWKSPAKGKRGSIWNEHCDVGEHKPASVFGGGLYKR